MLLHAEGLFVAVVAGIGYFHEGFAWWCLVAFVLAPDLSMLGYVGGRRIGCVLYDAAHTYLGALALLIGGIVSGHDLPTQIALIWAIHIGADRVLGYGLKYSDGFKHTHLQEV